MKEEKQKNACLKVIINSQPPDRPFHNFGASIDVFGLHQDFLSRRIPRH